MSESVKNFFATAIDEATGLRFGASLPDGEFAPRGILLSLIDARRRIDRIEELLAQATRIRARAHRNVAAAKAEADEAWNRASVESRVRVQQRDDFVAPRERYADNELSTITQQRALRVATEMASYADECYDVLRILHRGLDGLRQDLLAIIRAIQFESSLERTSPGSD